MKIKAKAPYKSVTFQAVDPGDETISPSDTFELDELGWSVTHTHDEKALHAFCEATMYKWAQAMK